MRWPWAQRAAFTIARIPARMASGRSCHRSTTRASSGSPRPRAVSGAAAADPFGRNVLPNLPLGRSCSGLVYSETKLDLQKREFVEIGVPDQWLAYLCHLAVMGRIYYFNI